MSKMHFSRVALFICAIILFIKFSHANTSSSNYTISYAGCYNDLLEERDVFEKDYSYEIKSANTMNIIELCGDLCGNDGFRVAAIQSYDECYCGNSFGRYDKTDETECFFKCGNYSCGGYSSNSIYLIQSETNKFGSYKALGYEQPNPCLNNPCKNFGTCVTIYDGNGHLKNFICKCNHVGYLGPLCEQKDHCFSNPCQNGATCLNLFDKYKCTCTSIWTGNNCEQILFPSEKLLVERDRTCTPNEILQCGNGGTCVKHSSNNSIVCKCPLNYSGNYCEIFDICSVKPCKNTGKCVFNAPSNFKCECGSKYTGPLCELNNPCASMPCLNNAHCVPTQNPYVNNSSYTCECLSGFAGSNCELSSTFERHLCPCKNGACQMYSGGYHCECFNGWTGPHCDLACQFDSDCMNNGTCVQTLETNYCECVRPYYGDKCEQEARNLCLPNPCKNDYERCLLSVDNATYICESIDDFSNKNWCLLRENLCNQSSKCVFNEINKSYSCECMDSNATNCNYNLTNDDLHSLITASNKHSPNLAQNQFLGLSIESLYWIVPIIMIVTILSVFLGICGYMGYKAKQNGSLDEKDRKLHTSVVNMHFLTQPSLSHDYSMKHASTISVPNVSFSSPLSFNPSQADSFDKV